MRQINENDRAIGRRVQQLRLLNFYTYRRFGELFGHTAAYWSKVEKGQARLNADDLVKLCNYFSVSSDFILFGKER